MQKSEISDAEFLASFEGLRISGNEFRHTDHVRLAWIYLHDSEFAAGASRFCSNFRSFVRHIGAESKYHETITWFYLVTVFERIRTQATMSSWDAFARSNGDLLDSSMDLLRVRYRTETLCSPLARSVFLLPDQSTMRSAAAPASLPGRRSLALAASAAGPPLLDAATHPENLSPL